MDLERNGALPTPPLFLQTLWQPVQVTNFLTEHLIFSFLRLLEIILSEQISWYFTSNYIGFTFGFPSL